MSEDLSGGCSGEPPRYVWPYGLGDLKTVEGLEVTDEHRAAARNATDCECLFHFDAGVSALSPGFRKYGGTLAKIATQFLEAREVIREEVNRLAYRNLLAVVTGNPGGRRVMNAYLATAEKEARDKPAETPVDPKVSTETSDFLKTD